METGPRLKISSDRLVMPGIKPAIPGLQGKRFIHYTTAAPVGCCVMSLSCGTSCPFQFCNHAAEEKKAGCFTFIVF